MNMLTICSLVVSGGHGSVTPTKQAKELITPYKIWNLLRRFDSSGYHHHERHSSLLCLRIYRSSNTSNASSGLALSFVDRYFSILKAFFSLASERYL